MTTPIISVEKLGKRYRIWTHSRPTTLSDRVRIAVAHARKEEAAAVREEIWALRDVSFEVNRAEVLGIIGPNGAGKSTLLSILAHITDPTEGSATIQGRVSSLLEVGTGFHPELSGRDNVFLNGAVLGMSRAETAKKFDEIVEFSGVHDFIDMPVKRYSSGMYVRLAFSVAAHLDPEVLLLDEVLAVGDQAFQQKCLHRIEEITKSGKTVLFVSHDVNSVARISKTAIVISNGGLIFHGDVGEAIETYMRSEGLGGETAVVRRGTGDARIVQVAMTNTEGGSELYPDRPVQIDLELEARSHIRGRDLAVHLVVGSAVGGDLTTLSTQLSAEQLLGDLGPGERIRLTCLVDDLPLRPGPYHLSAEMTRPGEVLDHVERIADFVLLPSDFFGRGVAVSEHLVGHLLVRQSWKAARLETREPILLPVDAGT
jgi:lipopolysaccharide transport system ATP-binding protein